MDNKEDGEDPSKTITDTKRNEDHDDETSEISFFFQISAHWLVRMTG
jgi:hypothetical protein